MKNNEQKKERIRERYKGISEDNLDVIPAIPQDSFYDESKKKRVAVYARVSTDDPSQTSSYELQKNHYTDMVNKRDDWDLIDIYADEGISGTSLQHRDSFLRMIKDCEDGKIDLIVTKSVSRFARNVLDCIGYVRQLKALKPPVGIYFETERIYTLSNNSEMSLSFIATLAQEESHNKSEIMNASIEMRFKRGIFLTPVLLGYDQDEEGNLIINEEEAKVVRLIFFLYLYGYSTQDIAGLLSKLQCRTKKGNTRWNAGSVLQILKNERHCGDVRARKTFTPNYLDHKSKKNNRERNQYIEKNHHESIISRDDFIAVQHMITNAKYGSQKFLPYLNVVSEGVLKGFILVNIKWSGFKAKDYLEASETISKETDKDKSKIKNNLLNDGDFDLRGFEVTRIQFLSITKKISVSISINELFFSNETIKKFPDNNHVQLYIEPKEKIMAVKPCKKDDMYNIKWSMMSNGKIVSRKVCCSAMMPTLYELLNWDQNCKYKCLGVIKEQKNQKVIIFNLREVEIMMPKEMLNEEDIYPISAGKKRVVAFPQEWSETFGTSVYDHPYTNDMLILKKKGKAFDSELIKYDNSGIDTTKPETVKEEIENLITYFEKEKTDGEDN